ncbi:MAG: formylglycine-generating enzyme family protein [Roseomonas sp.]|nr:formylglycine-generating enzyme family protein [Roseomonas sp.]MCA3408460.1 formylglycine-generating enzyme family protein [Roseomonas sp.]
MTRPEAIAALRERLAEVQRCTDSFGAVLPQTNQPGPLAFFPSVLERIRLILGNEQEGATGNLAAALAEVRKDIRRHPLPDLDPDLDERTQALFLLRGERGNLIEALENALDACNVLAMPLRASPEGDLELPREAVQDSLLRALDERLRRLDSAVKTMEEAAAKADTNAAAAGTNISVSQIGLINLSTRELKLDIAAARFETKIAADPGAPPTIDLGALARTLEAIRDTARDLRELVQSLHAWVAPAVVAAGRMVAAGAERAWRGLKTLVSKVRYERELSQQAQDTVSEDHSKPFRPPLEPLARWREPIPGLPEEAWPDMITLPTGEFLMGAPNGEEGSATIERPQRHVTVPRPFALGRTAVTFAMWDAAMAAGFVPPSGKPPEDAGWGRDDRPVINVSWDDAQAYCRWLNQRLGLPSGTYRLPSEAEWEYACRAGTTTPFSFGKTISTEEANYDGGNTYVRVKRGEYLGLNVYRGRTVPVGSLPANPWGLHEMHGNVLEWVEDAYGPYPAQATDASPLKQADDTERVLRGGSCFIETLGVRSATRFTDAAGTVFFIYGFRVARRLG